MTDRSEEETGARHVRRARYSGKYPRRYEEKYKELQPEKYAGEAQKVIARGGTPAGTHIPVCPEEILGILAVKPGETGLDATLGYGGHAELILRCLQPGGHLWAIDVDPSELEKTRSRLAALGYGEEILTVRRMNFAGADGIAAEAGPFDFVLADLGVSSMQIDNPTRGFSYKADGPLDLRMNQQKGKTGAERLRGMTRGELQGMLEENADEPFAAVIAAVIAADLRSGVRIDTTTALRNEVRKALRNLPREGRAEVEDRTCARVFQALRIDVNREYESLYAFLEKLPGVLRPGGRAAILTFHSGEDRLVKKAFQQGFRSGVYRSVAQDVIRPSAEECARNSRARSAKLRWAIRA